MTQSGHWQTCDELPEVTLAYFQPIDLTRYNALS
jgi:hypothetical protein